MTTVDYLPIANGVGANVETQAQYVIDLASGGSLVNGYQAGVAQSAQINKTVRQSSVMTAAIANFISTSLSTSVLDDGNVSALQTLFGSAIASAVGQNVFTGGTTTGSSASQTLASTTPTTGFSLSKNGQILIFTAGFAPGSSGTNLTITSPSISATAIKKPGTGGTLVPTNGTEWGAGETVAIAVNTTAACYELLDSPPLGSLALLNVGTNLISSGGNLNNGNTRVSLTGSTTFFVATTGNDSNTGLSSGQAWLTIQHAINTLLASYDLNGNTATISVADGTYSASILVQQAFTGGGAVNIVGNTTTPANVIISPPSGIGLYAVSGGVIGIAGATLSSGGSGGIVVAENTGVINLNNAIVLGACGSTFSKLQTLNGGCINMNNNFTMSGNSGYGFLCDRTGKMSSGNITVTMSGTPAFAQATAMASQSGCLYLSNVTFSGSATGVRYSATINGTINTNGGGASFIPGGSAGSVANGGVYV